MKNLAITLSILLMGFSASATSLKSLNFQRGGYDGNAFIFVEGDVEFSVFPDGQFDFIYIGPQKGSQITISAPNMNISFNSGYNYDAYVQYDSYGAVIQVENVPVFYDYYGRIIRAGNVDIQYNDRRLVRVGGLHIFYNNFGHFSYYTGVINAYNPYYVYRPWHVYYARPLYSHVIVYDYPYRRNYQPVRYSYAEHVHYYKNRGRVSYMNCRRDFYRPGSRIHNKDGRVTKNTNFDPNRRNTMISNSGRNNESVGNTRTNETTNVRSNNTDGRGASNIRNNGNETREVSNVRNISTDQTPRNTSSVQSSAGTTRGNTATPVKSPISQNGVEQANSVRANTVRATSTPKTVQRVETRSVSNNNRGASANQTGTQAPQRTNTNRNSVSAPKSSRSNPAVKPSRNTSSGRNSTVPRRG